MFKMFNRIQNIFLVASDIEKFSKDFSLFFSSKPSFQGFSNELGIKILWAGTNDDETKVYDITEVKDPSKFEVLTQRTDITQKRANAGV